MNITKTVVKFWTGANPEKMEAWLERMEAEGWHLVNVNWGGVRFSFEKRTSLQVRYCIDYRPEANDEYTGLLKDAGWELMCSSAGWLIWRMPYEGLRPELYSDLDSLIERNNRIITVFGILLLTQFPIALLNIRHFSLWVLLLLYVPVISLVGTTLVRMVLENQKLKTSRAQR